MLRKTNFNNVRKFCLCTQKHMFYWLSINWSALINMCTVTTHEYRLTTKEIVYNVHLHFFHTDHRHIQSCHVCNMYITPKQGHKKPCRTEKSFTLNNIVCERNTSKWHYFRLLCGTKCSTTADMRSVSEPFDMSARMWCLSSSCCRSRPFVVVIMVCNTPAKNAGTHLYK